MVTRLRILSKIAEMAARTSNGDAGGRALLDELPDSMGVTEQSLDDHVRLLDQQDFVRASFTFGGLAAVFIKPRGKDLAAQFERDRRDPVARLLQLQDDYLRWLYIKIEIEDIVPSADGFLDTEAGYLGVEYSAREVERATARLRAAELLLVDELDLTTAGRKVVEHKRSVRDLERGSTVNNVTTHVTRSTNVSVGSAHVTQTSTVGPQWVEEVTSLLEVLGQSLSALPESIAAAVQPLLDEAREATDKNEPSRAKKALGRVADFLNDTTAGALGGHLATQIPQILAILG